MKLHFPEELRGQRVIWSNEHRAWWRPNRNGYCTQLFGAGLYSPEEADEICRRAADRHEVHHDAEEQWTHLMATIQPTSLLGRIAAQDEGKD